MTKRKQSPPPGRVEFVGSDFVYILAGIAVLMQAYIFYRVLTTPADVLAQSGYDGFVAGPVELLALVGVVVSMIAGGGRPVPNARARDRRAMAALGAFGLFFLYLLWQVIFNPQ